MQTPKITFEPWPKIPRLFRDVIITEKIDGTNAGIYIDDEGRIFASSRKRWITPERDNFIFARWVKENAETLVADLGPGMHFGEWWGAGIQRRYDRAEKYFSLFNVSKWKEAEGTFKTPRLGVVPVLWEGAFTDMNLELVADGLIQHGSVASPGFMSPEGIVIFHVAANQCFKFTFDGDGHKG